ncbi:hypothetical protein ACNKHT_14535 [Shigella flexneri]
MLVAYGKKSLHEDGVCRRCIAWATNGSRLFIFSQQDNEPVALVTKFAGAEMRQTLTLHKGRIIFRWRRTFSNITVKRRTATKWASAGQTLTQNCLLWITAGPLNSRKMSCWRWRRAAVFAEQAARSAGLQSSETPQEIYADVDALVDGPWGSVIQHGSPSNPAQSRLAFACQSSKCRR